jgi:hypothetical protein
MLITQQSDNSIFSQVPWEVVNNISRMRVEATLAQQKLDKAEMGF